jgi:hypothetical protein
VADVIATGDVEGARLAMMRVLNIMPEATRPMVQG